MNHCLESVGVLLCTVDDDVVVDGMEFVDPLLPAPVWLAPLEPEPPQLPPMPLRTLLPATTPQLLLVPPPPPLPLLPLALAMLPLLEPVVMAVELPLPLTWPRAMAMGLGDESGDEDVNEEICTYGNGEQT